MAKGATSKKKREDEKRQEPQQRQDSRQREETRQRQQRTQREPSQNNSANSRQTTRRDVAPTAIPVLEERSTPRRSASGRNVASLFPESTAPQTTNIPKVEPIITNNKGQGFASDIEQRMYENYNYGIPLRRNDQGIREDAIERIKASDASQYGTEQAEEPQAEEYPSTEEKGRKEAQRKPERDNQGLTMPSGQNGEYKGAGGGHAITRLTTDKQYDDLAQNNSEFVDDIAKLAQINTGSVMGVSANPDMLAKGVTGKTLDEFYSDLQKKYNLSADELDDLALTYKSGQMNDINAELSEKATKFGEEHPVLGSAASLPITLANAVEGVNNVLVGGLTEDKRRLSNMASGTKEGFREGAKENLGVDDRIARLEKYNVNGINDRKIAALKNKDMDSNTAAQVAYDLGMGLGDLGVAALTGQAPAILAGNTANEATLGAVERGQDVGKAAEYGLGAGIIDLITNTIGLDKAKGLGMEKVAERGIEGVKRYLLNMGISTGAEAGENVIQDAVQTALDEAINKDKSEMQTNLRNRIDNGESLEEAVTNTLIDKAKDIIMSGATGAVMGAGMYGGTAVFNGIKGKIDIPKVDQTEIARQDVPKVDPLELARQNEIDADALNAERAQTLNEIQGLKEQISDTKENGEESDSRALAEEYVRLFPYSMGDENTVKRIINEMVEDLENGNNLDKYIASLETFMDDVDDATRGEMKDYLDALKSRKYKEYHQEKAEIYTKAAQEAYATGQVEIGDEYAALARQYKRNIPGANNRPLIKDVTGARRIGINSYVVGEYNGEKPVKTSENNTPVSISDDAFNKAKISLRNAGVHGKEVNLSRKTLLEWLYQDLFANEKAKEIPVNGLEFGGNGYKVTLNKQVVGKVMSDNDLSAEKLSILDHIEDVIRDANYLDSSAIGESKAEKRSKDLVRYDYFEKIVDINGKKYVVSFDVSSYPFANNYRTHKVNEINLTQADDDVSSSTSSGVLASSTDTANLAAAQEGGLGSTGEPVSNSKITQADNDVNPDDDGPDIPPSGGGGVPPTTPPNTPTNNGGGAAPSDIGQRRAYTNTGVKSGVVDPYDLVNNPTTQRDIQYEIHHNPEILDQAKQDIADNRDMYAEQYASGTKEIKTDLDMDRSMILLSDDKLSQWSRDSILRNLAKHGTEAGQFIQAFKKWANTSVGALAKATKIDNDTVDNWKSNNQRTVKANADLSSKLKKAIDNITDYSDRVPDDPKTLPIIRREVANTIDAYKKTWIADMNRVNEMMGEDPLDFSGEDIDYLAHMLDHGATVEELKDALNTKLATGRFGITADTQDQVNRLFQDAQQFDPDSKEFCEAQAEAFRLLAEEVAPNASPLEKFDAWRYMAMLGNPKTMLRNFVGNKMFSTVTGVSNNLAAAMEKASDSAYYKKTGQHIQRTKEFINPVKDKALIDGAAKFAENTAWRQVEGSKYERINQESLKNNRSVFKSDVMRLAEQAVNQGISDTNAVIKKFSTSMAGYMKANGLDTSAFDDAYRFKQLQRDSRVRLLSPEESAEMESLQNTADQMDKAREYALKQAEYATFHEDNKIADVLTKWSRVSRNEGVGLGSLLIEGTVPFKKTPANILRSGYDYSPFSAISSIAKTGKLVIENTGKNKSNLADEYTRTNKLTGKEKTIQRTLASDVIDSWSKTLTGSALTYLGYYLFNKGILTSSDKGEKYQDQLEGKGNYAININGHTYTLDWAAPGVMPLLIGAEVNKVLKANGRLDEEWYSNPDKWLEIINTLLDPLLETSMMSGVKDTLTNAANEVRYNENNALGGIIGSAVGNMATGYMTQAIPTLSGQIARTIDPVRRTTDTVNEGILGTLEKQGRRIANKIPFLSKINPEYRDAYGRGQTNGPFDYSSENLSDIAMSIPKFMGNLAYQMLSPGYYSKVNTTDADRLGRDLFNATEIDPLTGKERNIEGVTGDDKVFADWRSTKKIDGEKLNPEELQTFREKMGQANYALREGIYNSEWYNNLTPIQQRDVVASLNTIADKIGQYAVKPESVNVSGTLKTYLEAGGGEEGIQAIINELEADNNPYGLDKDVYADEVASGKDMSIYEGYSSTLEQLGLSDKKEYRSVWETQGVEGLEEIAKYNNAFANAGMETAYTSKSAKSAYENNQLEEYAKYREYIKENDIRDSESRWSSWLKEHPDEEEKEPTQVTESTNNNSGDWLDQALGNRPQGDIPVVTGDTNPIEYISSAGLNLYSPDASWNKAYSANPNLTPQEFVDTWSAVDADNNGRLKKAEFVTYLNAMGYTPEQAELFFNMYYPSSNKPLNYRNDKWYE